MPPQSDHPEHTDRMKDTMPQTAPRDVSVGSLFEADMEGVQGVVHWKRAFVRHVYPLVLLMTDVLLIAAIFSIVVALRYDVEIAQAVSRRVLAVIEFASITGVAMIGGYSYFTDSSRFRFISEHIIVSIGVFVGVFFAIYSFVSYGYKMNSGRSVVAATLIVFPVISIAYRYCLAKIKLAYQKGNALCIIGAGWAAVDLYRRLKERRSTYEVIVVDPFGKDVGNNLVEGDSGSPLVEPIEEIAFNSSMHGRYVENYVVASPLSDLPEDLVKRLAVAQFSGNNVCSYEAYLREKLMIIPPSEVTMAWALEEGFLLNKNVTYDRVKRFGDIIFGLTGLIVFAPVFVIIGILVWATSKGPIIFKQERVGKREVPFTLYKFRSMKVRSEKGSMYTEKNDSRLTPVGKFLRKTRLDELPQFWNVLKGDLSLIGPRAEWTELVRGYEQKFPYYHFRHAVKPGITGWAQVNYSYGASDKDTVEKLNYDLYYVRKHSMVLDAIIIVKTIYIVLFGRGQ